MTPSTGNDRLAAERAFHDGQAADRAGAFLDASRYRFTNDDYLNHETWIRPAFERLGDVRDKRALDFGCGHGMAAVVLARLGAAVSAFDLSPGYVREAQARAAANGVEIRFLTAHAESLPYADSSFDVIWGNAILHHLHMEAAGAELKRILAPGGVAVFSEPWGGNPLLEFARRRLPYSGKHRTRDEQPLSSANIKTLTKYFPDPIVDYYQLFAMLRKVRPRGFLPDVWDSVDRRLFDYLPSAKNWCRYVVLTLRRD